VTLHLVSPYVHLRIGWLLVAIVIALSLAPNVPIPQTVPGYSDKVAHVLAYSGLTMWFAIAALRHRWQVISSWFFLLGAVIETGQAIVPYRMASLEDIIANSVGIIFGLLMATLLIAGSRTLARAK
jgi:VanZ family protein